METADVLAAAQLFTFHVEYLLPPVFLGTLCCTFVHSQPCTSCPVVSQEI